MRSLHSLGLLLVTGAVGCTALLGATDVPDVPEAGPGGVVSDGGLDVSFDAQQSKDAPDSRLDSSASNDGRSGDAELNDSSDARLNDVGSSDTGPSDAGPNDAGPNDAGDTGPNDAGPSDAGDADAPACSNDLSNVLTGDFIVEATVTTTQQTNGNTAFINQRKRCGNGLYWDIRIQMGQPNVEVEDANGRYTQLIGTGPLLNDGSAHVLVVSRKNMVLSLSVDGIAGPSAPCVASLGPLPAFQAESDPCEGVMGGNTIAFVGTIANVCAMGL